MHIRKQLILLNCSALIVCLSGCMPKHQNAIFFSTNTIVGVKVGTNVNQVPEIDVGYQRQEAAYVPVYVELGDGFEMTQKDALVSQYLGKALENLNVAYKGGSPVLKHSTTITSVEAAKSAVAQASAQSTEKSNKNRGSVKSKASIYDLDAVGSVVNTLDGNTSGAVDYKKAIDTIEVQLDRPQALVSFYEQGKFVSQHNPNGLREDAYSVLGTFSGDMEASSSRSINPNNEAATTKGSIAQYFATGNAAQLLAEKGGAAAVSGAPSAKTPAVTYDSLSADELKAILAASLKKEELTDQVLAKLVGKDMVTTLTPLIGTNSTIGNKYTNTEMTNLAGKKPQGIAISLSQRLTHQELKDLNDKL